MFPFNKQEAYKKFLPNIHLLTLSSQNNTNLTPVAKTYYAIFIFNRTIISF